MKPDRKEIMREFLDNQITEYMQKYGMTRLEALKAIKEILDEDQNNPVIKVIKEMQGDGSNNISLVNPEYSDKDFLIMLLENLRDDFYIYRYGRLYDIAMFLHRDECEPHTPYIPRNTLNMSDMNILEREYKLTQDELRYYKLIDFE